MSDHFCAMCGRPLEYEEGDEPICVLWLFQLKLFCSEEHKSLWVQGLEVEYAS